MDVKEYLNALSLDRNEIVEEIRQIILKSLPEGFEEMMLYGHISYVVPLSIYPSGYHCKPSDPLPFLSLASTKNHIAIHHLGLYCEPELIQWFENEYKKAFNYKLDLGKGCIRFKNPKSIPYDLISELCRKISVKEWIETYELKIKN